MANAVVPREGPRRVTKQQVPDHGNAWALEGDVHQAAHWSSGERRVSDGRPKLQQLEKLPRLEACQHERIPSYNNLPNTEESSELFHDAYWNDVSRTGTTRSEPRTMPEPLGGDFALFEYDGSFNSHLSWDTAGPDVLHDNGGPASHSRERLGPASNHCGYADEVLRGVGSWDLIDGGADAVHLDDILEEMTGQLFAADTGRTPSIARLLTPPLPPLSTSFEFCACCDQCDAEREDGVGEFWHLTTRARGDARIAWAKNYMKRIESGLKPAGP
ncbi:hypothetical protein HIM_05188 [Hirsutella minnesotensis 3608]|uniref:Uncharacterized protein n=1 Tax=Hirsutella minnesotensis 3608 TaxID=1043627 RepID=A0A0F8A0M8_9HYPO|nr:hypothetical protein HIM_05188 [Hirsutella minnesotensis 3608]